MSTDKTLADVKHGGCVRLGDGLADYESMTAITERLGSHAYVAEQSGERRVCKDIRALLADHSRLQALSAQPSPGGQDALASELLAHAEGLERMAADDRETGLSIEQAIEDGEGYTPDEATDVAAGLQHDAERGEDTAALLRKAVVALASRQPVGSMSSEASQVARGMVAHCIEHRLCMGMGEGFSSFDPDVEHPFVQELREFAEGSRQPAGEPVGYATFRDGRFGSWLFQTRAMAESHDSTAVAGGPANSEIVPLFRSPAQAVDLAEFKALYRAYVRLLESGRDRIIDFGGTCDPVDVMEANDVDLQAARRVIDSQAVGNG